MRGSLTIGVDAGGTWVRVVALRKGRWAANIKVPASRVPELRKFLLSTWKRRGWTRTPPAALVVASRGVWTVRERQHTAQRLRGLAERVLVLSDAQAAFLGALGHQSGVLILSGTGSIAIGRDERGQWARAGGLGPLLGDEGSAFWLGREWLRRTVPGEHYLQARRLGRTPDAVRRIASLAPRVLRRAREGDRRARAIVREGQAHLARLAITVARDLRLRPPVTISWAGTVMSDDRYRSGVRRAVARAGLRTRWRRPAEAPVRAVARLATEIASSPPETIVHENPRTTSAESGTCRRRGR